MIMANEFRLSYTGSEIDSKLRKIDSLASKSEIPSKTSELANDSGFTTQTYVQNYAQPKGDYVLKSEIQDAPVQSVNGKTGEVILIAEDIGAASQEDVGTLQNSVQTKAEIVTLTTSEYEELETNGSTNANALYMLTDTDGEENNFIQVSDTMPTDEEVEIWINTSEEYDDSNSGGSVNITAESIVDALGYTPANETELTNKVNTSDLGSLATKSTVEKTDLSSVVQTSLGKADSALQSYTETDPTVPAWAKASTKPSYTKSEVGLGNVDNVKQYSASNPPPYPVSSVNGKTGAVSLTASDVGARASTWMPTAANVGADASGTASSAVSAHNSSTTAHTDIREAIQTLSNEKVDQTAIVQEIGTDTSKVMSQKAVTDALLNLNQAELLFVSSVEEMTDTSKFYVKDGFIWAYQYVEATGQSYTNLSETVHENYRMGSGGTLSALAGAMVTDFIPVRKGQTVRFKGFNPLEMPSSKYPYICFYTGASESNVVSSGIWNRLDWLSEYGKACLYQEDDGTWVYTAFMTTSGAAYTGSGYYGQHSLADSITHIRMCGTMLDGETVIVTVDEEITEGSSEGGYEWKNTGQAFAPADYEPRILALENNKADKTAIPTTLPNPNALTIDGVKYDGSVAVNIETQSGGNILYGKKWVACGDSFTHGGYNASDGFDSSVYVYQDGRFAGKNIVYPYIIGLRNNMNIVNLATGGQTMAQSSNSFMSRYANIDADADYITIMLGINDKLQNIPVGTLEDSTNTTFCGAFNIAMEHILENHPFAHIGIMVSHGTNAEIMEATRGIAERWGVPYLDYGSPQVPLMNRYTGRSVCAKAQEIREKNFCVISDGVTPTNSHPNTAAHEFESTFIEAWLRTL